MTELTKILKDEAWLEGEKRGMKVPLSDSIVFNRALKIWEDQNETKVNRLDLEKEDRIEI